MTAIRLPKRLSRPLPPLDSIGFREFLPATELGEWARAVFIEEGGPLANPDHEHLNGAAIGWLWTVVDNTRAMRRIIGQAELMPPNGMGKWQKARAAWQVEQWFGETPDFLITFDAHAMATLDDASFCAVVEHELYHCTQLADVESGLKRWHQDGSPFFSIRGHDVEEFVGVVARYGTAATDTQRMVAAANKGPSVALADIGMACGTCQQRRRA